MSEPIWSVTMLPSVERTLRRLHHTDRQVYSRVIRYIRETVANLDDPRSQGNGPMYNRRGEWRCRVGDYRIIVEIRDRELVILVIDVFDRPEGY